jgi:hypothetical protein
LSLIFINFFIYSFQLTEEERRGKSIEMMESPSEDEDEDTENVEEDSDEDGDGSSSTGDVDDNSDHEETYPKVEITG